MVASRNGMFDDNVQSVSVKKPKRTTKKKVDPRVAERDKLYASFTKKQKLAFDLAMAGENVLITGGGGVGKSFLTKGIVSTLRNLYGKQVIVCAPTGVAANNIGGVTIHRQFGFPIGPCLVGKKGKLRPIEHADAALKCCDVICIDEISMLRIDVWDSLYYSIRKANKFKEEKGLAPIKIFAIGDFYQLPPIVKDGEERLFLESYYNNKRHSKTGQLGAGYAFNSVTWDKVGFKVVVLDEVMRQKNQETVYHLNKIREGKKGFTNYFNQVACMEKIEDAITLHPYNKDVARENAEKLSSIEGETYTFIADLYDRATEMDCEGRYKLEVKIGAKVMFTVNDSPHRKNDLVRNRPEAWQDKPMFVNGTTGIVRNVHVDKSGLDDYITVELSHSGEIIDFRKSTNDVIIYDEEDGKLIERKIGAWRQYGLILAFSCSVHKSQGLSLQRVNINPVSFAHGQLYVALSRCTDVETLHLEDFIREEALIMDEEVAKFYKELKEYIPE